MINGSTESLTITRRFAVPLQLVLATTLFVIPFVLGGPQWLVGTIVNSLLFVVAAKNYPAKTLLVLLSLPSIAVLSRGIIFGPFTYFLIYFLPFIWLGNALLVYIFSLNKFTPSVRVVIAALIKSAFLFGCANLFFRFHVVPAVFINSMGLIQIYTALAGGLIYLLGSKLLSKYD